MTEDFKKWLCEKAGMCITKNGETTFSTKGMDALLLGNEIIITLEILIKAFLQINRENNAYEISMDYSGCFVVDHNKGIDNWTSDTYTKCYFLWDHNNSEQEALTAALEYIYKESK